MKPAVGLDLTRGTAGETEMERVTMPGVEGGRMEPRALAVAFESGIRKSLAG